MCSKVKQSNQILTDISSPTLQYLSFNIYTSYNITLWKLNDAKMPFCEFLLRFCPPRGCVLNCICDLIWFDVFDLWFDISVIWYILTFSVLGEVSSILAKCFSKWHLWRLSGYMCVRGRELGILAQRFDAYTLGGDLSILNVSYFKCK